MVRQGFKSQITKGKMTDKNNTKINTKKKKKKKKKVRKH